jgi:radical SAM superfamily enzyme YgiQ (UPF0313 family)
MRVRFLHPKYDFYEVSPPLGLMYLAAALEAVGHEVEIFDASVDDGDFCSGHETIDLVGVGFTSQLTTKADEMIRDLRKSGYEGPVVVGGPHVSIAKERVFKDIEAKIDMAVISEGEAAIVEICEALQGKREFGDIPGLIWMNEGALTSNPLRPLTRELDGLPFPARHQVQLDKYHVPGSIMTSRGCPFKCTYCSKYLGNSYRAHGVDYVINEIAHMIEKYGTKRLFVCDDNFLVDKRRAIAIFNAIVERGWKLRIFLWNGVRVDSINEEVIAAARRAGVYQINCGVENLNQDVLKLSKKGISREQIAQSVQLCRKYGITVKFHLVVGLAGDTLANTRWMMKELWSLGVDKFYYNLATPYENTELWDWVDKNGRWLVDREKIRDYSWHNFFDGRTRPVFDTLEFPEADRLLALDEMARFVKRYRILNMLRGRFWRVAWQRMKQLAEGR